MSIETELEKIADKVGESFDEIKKEFEKEYEKYEKMGIDRKTFLRIFRGKYKAQLRSNAKAFDGYFFALTPLRNVTAIIYREAIEKIDEYKEKYGDEWLDRAIKDNIVNEKGEPIYNEENTTEAQSWMRGKPIPEKKLECRGFGFFKEKDGNELKFCTVYIRNPEFKPELLKFYRIRFGGKFENGVLSTTNVSELKELGDVTFDDFIRDLTEHASSNLVTFEEVYDVDQKIAMLPEGVNIGIAKVSVSAFRIVDELDVDFIEVTDLNSDFENVSMAIEKDLSKDVYEGAIGVIAFYPYFRNGEEPAGNCYGFIPMIPKPGEIEEIKVDEEDDDWTEEEDWE